MSTWTLSGSPLTSWSWAACLAWQGPGPPVATVVGSIANGLAIDEILAEYPQLTHDDTGMPGIHDRPRRR
jgi:hypothetical protein